MVESQGDGILNSSINKLFVFLYTVLICSCANGTEPLSKQCVEDVLKVRIVKVDKKNQHYFIAASDVAADVIAANTSKLRGCFTNSPWKDIWSLSVFSDPKYAGYKDEEHIIPYHKNNSWAKAYVAEYDSQTNTLTSYPAYKPKHILP